MPWPVSIYSYCLFNTLVFTWFAARDDALTDEEKQRNSFGTTDRSFSPSDKLEIKKFKTIVDNKVAVWRWHGDQSIIWRFCFGLEVWFRGGCGYVGDRQCWVVSANSEYTSFCQSKTSFSISILDFKRWSTLDPRLLLKWHRCHVCHCPKLAHSMRR